MAREVRRSGKVVPGFTKELGERIKLVIEAIGTQKSAAQLVNVRPETIAAWQRGEQRPPFLDMITLCDASGYSIAWLAGAKGGGDSGADSSHGLRTQRERELPMMHYSPDAPTEALVVIPKLEVRGSAGTGAIAPAFPQVEAMVALSREFLRSIGVPATAAELLEVEGDSMSPTLNDRDIAVLDTSIDEVRTDAIYAVVYGGRVLIKRIQIGRDGSVTLSSDNKSAGYRDERIPSAELYDLHIAGRVKGRVGGL